MSNSSQDFRNSEKYDEVSRQYINAGTKPTKVLINIDVDKFEMELIEFQSSSIWKQKFIDLRVDLKNIKKSLLEKEILERSAENELLRTWNAIPENFSCLKSVATALLSMFSSTYALIYLWIIVLSYELY